MPQEEQYGTRSQHYSAWHRRHSIGRFIAIASAETLGMIDLDVCIYVEYEDRTKEPLALIETALDVGQVVKSATVTKKLALLAGLPAFTLLYTLATTMNPADKKWRDIASFRVRRIAPEPETDWYVCSPKGWANRLVLLRTSHVRRRGSLQ